MKYLDYSNVFSSTNTVELPKYNKINNYAINLKKDIQQLFKFISNLKLVKIEMIKTYIKINLVNGFIWLFKSLIRAFILFNWKSRRSFYLCINNQSLNNLIIKNQYLLFLSNELLNQLS